MARKTVRMKPITEEEWNLVSEENKDLVSEFLEYCKTIDKSPKTIINYDSDLHIIMNFFRCKLKNKLFTDITKRDVIKFQGWCLDQGMSPARVRRLRSSCSSLSNYIENMLDDEFPNFRNIINKIPAPSLSFVREKTVLSEDEIDDLLDTLVENKEYQLACCIAILCASGMRKSEIIQCQISWFKGDNVKIANGMYVSPLIRTKGAGVGGKKLNKYIICEIADKYLDLWFKEREELGIDIEPLFAIKRNEIWEGIKESTIDSWMRRLSDSTNKDIYPHCLRHLTATFLSKHDVDIQQIRDFFGHNDSSTTEIYIDIGKEENLKGMLSFLEKDDED